MLEKDVIFIPDGKGEECEVCGIMAFPHLHRAGTLPKEFERIPLIKQVYPRNEIRDIWDEMKELKRLTEAGEMSMMPKLRERRANLAEKYEEIETLFGHESTLSKAMIYYLDQK